MTVKRYIITADDVVDNLTSTDTTVPLSAKQGNVLAGRATSLETRTTTLEGKTANATTSSKGIVQVGSGLSVSNGVISVSSSGSSVVCPNVSTENNSGFKIGEMTFTYNQHTLSSVMACTSGAWTNIGDPYTPTLVQVSKRCAPFTYDIDDIPYPTITAKMNFVSAWFKSGSSVVRLGTGWGLRAVRVSDGTILGSATGNTSTIGVVTASITIPSDWVFGTDVIQFQYYISTVSGAYGQGQINTGDFINNLENEYTIYYSPVAEEFT